LKWLRTIENLKAVAVESGISHCVPQRLVGRHDRSFGPLSEMFLFIHIKPKRLMFLYFLSSLGNIISIIFGNGANTNGTRKRFAPPRSVRSPTVVDRSDLFLEHEFVDRCSGLRSVGSDVDFDTDPARSVTNNPAMQQTASRLHLFPFPKTIGPSEKTLIEGRH
jgi:hypothetical protein